MAKLHIHPIGLIIILLGLASWVLALAGLAASTAFCNKNNVEESWASCSQAYQQDWWAIFFELFILLVMLFTCFLNIFPKAQYVYLTYLAMVTALLSFTTQRMYTKSFSQGWLAVDLTSRAYDAAGVGSMFLCMVNFALIIFIGVGAAKASEGAMDRSAFTSVSTQGPATGLGSNGMGLVGTGPHDMMLAKQGVPPAAPASF